jgi:hypothetical protein
MKITIEEYRIEDVNIRVRYNDLLYYDVPKREFQDEVNQRSGRLWKMQVVHNGVTFERHGVMDWDEYYESPLLEVDLIAFLEKNIRRRHAKYANQDDLN